MTKIKKLIKDIILISCIVFLMMFSFFFIGFGKTAENIDWGVNFSQKHSENMGLDWRNNYKALLDDLAVKNIKISTHWDFLEPTQGKYNFTDLDWQISEAEKKGAKILLVMGMKTPRWPECHIPEWANNLSKENQQQIILSMVKEIVLRYKNSNNVWGWQVENEIFFSFGQCPWMDKDFLKKEVALVKSLDSRPIIITDSGEYSLWWQAASIGDIVGITTYRKVWFKEIKSYFPYPLPPIFYTRRAGLIKEFFNKEVMCVELQAEPWGPNLLYDLPLDVQKKSMDIERFKKNIDFAKKTGLRNFYLWGAEWWYWMKEKQNNPEIWNEAKKLFTKQ